MITHNIRAFMSRDWGKARDAKDRYWARRIAQLGAAEGIRVADHLRRQCLALHPGWPSNDDRRADLEFHITVARRLRRAG